MSTPEYFFSGQVHYLVDRAALPSMTTGIFSPGRTTKISPCTLLIDTVTSFPSRTQCRSLAVQAAIRLFKASVPVFFLWRGDSSIPQTGKVNVVVRPINRGPQILQIGGDHLIIFMASERHKCPRSSPASAAFFQLSGRGTDHRVFFACVRQRLVGMNMRPYWLLKLLFSILYS